MLYYIAIKKAQERDLTINECIDNSNSNFTIGNTEKEQVKSNLLDLHNDFDKNAMDLDFAC